MLYPSLNEFDLSFEQLPLYLVKLSTLLCWSAVCSVNLTSFMSALEFLSSNCENCFGQLDGVLDK